ncbi:peptidase T [Abiotrophia defectiva]|uniref:Peptidase T n=2 Tax=Abiotrophia defectiva TaxID=46125 RepID=W1Q5H8_ABIDE|nr:peptidase T [Abiotrophia defectiva]ESK66515.1 peptidase T [Abiotrophia defectiva ATCC 49176]QKH46220.1 peptidase T [Abiotrophia defectiva]
MTEQFFQETQERLIRYAKINTRSDEASTTVPSTACQLDLLHLLVDELKAIGLQEVKFNPENAFVTATLPATSDKPVPTIGFIAHVDTADFNSENVQPRLIPNYDGQDIVLNQAQDIVMKVADFPALSSYQGQTLIVTDGTTLLGADDKSGIAEIMTAVAYLAAHPEIEHGKVRVAFGPDEEIGRGADRFDVAHFGCDFAYTMDGGPVGELQYESFNAAGARLHFHGKNIHPGTAKGKMINAVQLLKDFLSALPEDQVPEKTDGRQGFIHPMEAQVTVDQGQLDLIIRDHDRQAFQAKKDLVQSIVDKMNAAYPVPVLSLEMKDQYYNMAEVIEQDMQSVELAKSAMEAIGIKPIIEPIRGGTDGSKISFMGLPTPNIFAGGENMHGRYEFVAVESMVKATQVIVGIIQANAQA